MRRDCAFKPERLLDDRSSGADSQDYDCAGQSRITEKIVEESADGGKGTLKYSYRG